MRDLFDVAVAWTLLHGMSVSLTVLGFYKTSRIAIRRVPEKRRAAVDRHDELVARVAHAIGTAKRWHMRMTEDDCLPVALAGVYMLRRAGADAELALGVTRFPFTAHAWVVAGERVIDFPPDKYKQFLAVRISHGA